MLSRTVKEYCPSGIPAVSGKRKRVFLASYSLRQTGLCLIVLGFKRAFRRAVVTAVCCSTCSSSASVSEAARGEQDLAGEDALVGK